MKQKIENTHAALLGRLVVYNGSGAHAGRRCGIVRRVTSRDLTVQHLGGDRVNRSRSCASARYRGRRARVLPEQLVGYLWRGKIHQLPEVTP